MGLIGDIFKGISSKNAASAASGALQGGAKAALTEEQQNQQDAMAAQKTATDTNTANQAPYTALGSSSAGRLNDLLSKGFTAPTLAEAQTNPGYKFALESGTAALDKSAAARGNVFSGTAGTALEKFGQDLGTTNYQQVYNNAVNGYMTNYSTLLGGTNVGEGAVGEEGQLGQAAAQNTSGVDLTAANQQALQINNAAAARASGYLGKSAALNGMVDNMGNTVSKAAAALYA